MKLIIKGAFFVFTTCQKNISPRSEILPSTMIFLQTDFYVFHICTFVHPPSILAYNSILIQTSFNKYYTQLQELRNAICLNLYFS